MRPARSQRQLKALNKPHNQDNGATGTTDTVPETQNKLKVIAYTV